MSGKYVVIVWTSKKIDVIDIAVKLQRWLAGRGNELFGKIFFAPSEIKPVQLSGSTHWRHYFALTDDGDYWAFDEFFRSEMAAETTMDRPLNVPENVADPFTIELDLSPKTEVGS
jgi:hypothetical protein